MISPSSICSFRSLCAVSSSCRRYSRSRCLLCPASSASPPPEGAEGLVQQLEQPPLHLAVPHAARAVTGLPLGRLLRGSHEPQEEERGGRLRVLGVRHTC